MSDSRPDTYQHIGQVRGLLLGFVKNLTQRAHVHDASKLEEPEKAIFDVYGPKLKETTYGSPEYEQHLAEMQKALDHHYRYNDHHPDHFGEPKVETETGIRVGGIHDMGLHELAEMICDWIAAGRRQPEGDIRKSIDQNVDRFCYGPEIKRLLHNTVDQILADELSGAETSES